MRALAPHPAIFKVDPTSQVKGGRMNAVESGYRITPGIHRI
jgi:hypothetical protein